MIITRKCRLTFEGKLALTLENACRIGHRRRCPSVTMETAIFLGNNSEIETSFIGMGTSIGSDTLIKATHSIGRFSTIGSRCMIGVKKPYFQERISSSVIVQNNKGMWYQDFFNVKMPYTFLSHPRVKIGNDVWIGDSCFIGENVTIGNGVIVEPGSVVSEDIPEYAIVKGNPMEIVGYRFKKEIVERLKSIMWWNYGLNLIEDTLLDDLAIEELIFCLEQKKKEKVKIPYGENGFLLVSEEKVNSIYRLNKGGKELLYRLNNIFI